MTYTCDVCNGRGESDEGDTCETCLGTGETRDAVEYNLGGEPIEYDLGGEG